MIKRYCRGQGARSSCSVKLNSRHLHVSLQLCPTFCNPMDCSPPGSSVHRDSPGKNTGVDCQALLQGIIRVTQETSPNLLCLLALAHGFFITSATCEAPSHLSKCNQFQNLLLIFLLFSPFLSFFLSNDFSNSQPLAPSPLPSSIYKSMDESQYSELRNGDIILMDSPFRALSILILHYRCWCYFRLKIDCKEQDIWLNSKVQQINVFNVCTNCNL